MIVFRVQDSQGRGPFKPGVPAKWADPEFAPGMKALPTFMEEFGFDVFDRLGRPGEHFGSAVRRARSISDWFSKSEQIKLHDLGYRLTGLRNARVLAESQNQIVFARSKPLWMDAETMNWPFEVTV